MKKKKKKGKKKKKKIRNPRNIYKSKYVETEANLAFMSTITQ